MSRKHVGVASMPLLRLILNTVVALIVLLLAALGARHMIRTKPDVPQRPPSRLVGEVLAAPLAEWQDVRNIMAVIEHFGMERYDHGEISTRGVV